jgi:hypothetical protein
MLIASQVMEDMIIMAVGMEIMEAMVVMITLDMADMETMVNINFFSFNLISGLLWFRRVTLVECKKLIIQYQVLAM